MSEAKRKPGRPPEAVPKDKAESLALWISEGKTTRDWCRQNSISVTTVWNWMQKDAAFAETIARARELGEEVIAQECMAIADTPLEGEEQTIKADGGIEIKKSDMLGHRKLQIETRLKLLAKWNPKKWGDRQQIEHSGKVGLESLIVGDE